jgi:RNA polymerase sigma-70 factor (ECF subfamily)
MDSFESLFQTHHKSLCSLAYNIVGDKDAAKDIVQDVFFKLWKNRNEIDFGGKIRNYLFRATSHASLNYLRFNKKILHLSNADELESLHLSPSSDEQTLYSELEVRVRKAIDKLPPKCKAIYLMSRHEGLKYQEIADTLEISLKTVENQMGIALQKLREELKPFITPGFIVLLLAAGILFTILFLKTF